MNVESLGRTCGTNSSVNNNSRIAQQVGNQIVHGDINYGGAPPALDDEEQNRKCLADLRCTDPRADKKRIEASKDSILDGSCDWVFRDAAFLQWWDSYHSNLLWISGDPGKGKTMIAMATISEVQSRLHRQPREGLMAFFFFQSTVPELNNAVSALRGLIYLLVDQQPSVIRHLREKYDSAGHALFGGRNALYALWGILEAILQDLDLPNVYLLIDALDECDHEQAELICLITRSQFPEGKVRWILTSRNEVTIKEELQSCYRYSHTSLELNTQNVVQAVDMYIDIKIDELAKRKGYNDDLKAHVKSQLSEKAEGTFLWVSLAFRELLKVKSARNVRATLGKLPSGLRPLYERMLLQVERRSLSEGSEDFQYIRHMISVVGIAYRPLSLEGLGYMAGLPNDISQDKEEVGALLELCGSFLVVRDEVVYPVHQSAQDFFVSDSGEKIFHQGEREEHFQVSLRSLHLMSETLRTDICGFKLPGTLRDRVHHQMLKVFPERILYACRHWADHLNCFICKSGDAINELAIEPVNIFLRAHLLHWLEALAWMQELPAVLRSIGELTISVANVERLSLPLIHDIRRFMLKNNHILAIAPLQVYSSGVVFSPLKSHLRNAYPDSLPRWIQGSPGVDDHWNNVCVSTLEGHSDTVTSAQFSVDGKLIASTSCDHTIRVWDSMTGACQGTLEGHDDHVNTVSFSPNGKPLIVSASNDKTVRLWDTETRSASHVLKGHSDAVRAAKFSPNSQMIASISSDKTVRLWDVATGTIQSILEGHQEEISSAVFSPDGDMIASSSNESIVRLWSVRTGKLLRTLYHDRNVMEVMFSSDGKLLASILHQGIELWDLKKWSSYHTVRAHPFMIRSAKFSPNNRVLAFASTNDKTVRLWDTTTRREVKKLKGHSECIKTFTFSPDGTRLASASLTGTIIIWCIDTGLSTLTVFGRSLLHVDKIPVTFSPDSKLLVSASSYDTLKLWDVEREMDVSESPSSDLVDWMVSSSCKTVASKTHDREVVTWDVATGAARSRSNGHTNTAYDVAVSLDGDFLASASVDKTVRIWDKKGRSLGILEGHGDLVRNVWLSPDNRFVVSFSDDDTLKLWDVESRVLQNTMPAVPNSGWTWLPKQTKLVFSPDNTMMASSIGSKSTMIWCLKSGTAYGMLEGHSDSVCVLAFSRDSRMLASGSDDRTVRLWDVKTFSSLMILRGHEDNIYALAFSPGSTSIASASSDKLVKVWNTHNGDLIESVYTGCYILQLFFLDSGHYLYSEYGYIPATSLKNARSSNSPERPSLAAIRDEWILWNNQRLLWLPVEYRGELYVLHNKLIMKRPSKSLHLLVFDLDVLYDLFSDVKEEDDSPQGPSQASSDECEHVLEQIYSGEEEDDTEDELEDDTKNKSEDESEDKSVDEAGEEVEEGPEQGPEEGPLRRPLQNSLRKRTRSCSVEGEDLRRVRT